jgi:hypothetical protein
MMRDKSKKVVAAPVDKIMVGQACYLIINQPDYIDKFNNKNANDVDNTKILLMMPMVP